MLSEDIQIGEDGMKKKNIDFNLKADLLDAIVLCALTFGTAEVTRRTMTENIEEKNEFDDYFKKSVMEDIDKPDFVFAFRIVKSILIKTFHDTDENKDLLELLNMIDLKVVDK